MTIDVRKIRIGGGFLMAAGASAMTVAAPAEIDLSADGGPASLHAAAAKHGNGGRNAGLGRL